MKISHRAFVENSMRVNKGVRGKYQSPVWTPEDMQQLIKLKEQGLTTPQIAKKLGRTKNAVCGKWFRLQELKEPQGKRVAPSRTWSTSNLTERWADRKKNA